MATLQDYVNQPAEDAITLASVNAMQSSVDPQARERSIQAFLSAYHTLGNHTFDDESITLTELLPNTSPTSPNLLALKDIQASFDTFSVEYVKAASNFATPPAMDCKPRLTPISVKNLPVGVYKDPKILTYYSVRLRARAKTMFSPFGEMELKAYAAARPFGSRVGPLLETPVGQFTQRLRPIDPNLLPTFAGATLLGFQPNLPALDADAGQLGTGWESNNVIGAMYRSLFPENANIGGNGYLQRVGQTEMTRGLAMAMAPNPGEGNRYAVPADLAGPQGGDPYIRNFDSEGMLAFWAPIAAPDKVGQLNNYLQESLAELLKEPPGNPIRPPTTGEPYKQALTADLIRYANTLIQGRGEDGETLNIAMITDPLSTRPVGNTPSQPLKPPLPQPKLLERDLAALKTSWVSEVDEKITSEKRTGYSVKFVTFESLTKRPTSTNGSTSANNPPKPDPEADLDLDAIRH
jgi:hypothetical protein